MGELDINDVHRNQGLDAARDMHDRATPFRPNGAGDAAEPIISAPLFDPWERYVVPVFPFTILPRVLQDHVGSQSEVTGVDPSAMAMSVLTAISGALDHRSALKMMRSSGSDWWPNPRLWTLLVGDPSTQKTPCIDAATRPLQLHENELRRDYQARLRDYQRAKQAKDSTVEEPEEPPRYIAYDVTTEKLGEILAGNEHGLMVKADEFSAWLSRMERYGGGASDRGFWLKAFDGGSYGYDRINRGSIYIPNLSVSLLGGIQPERLAELHGLTSDGLLQRFLPVMMRAATLPQDKDANQENYHKLITDLIRAPQKHMHMTDDALAAMNELRAHLFELQQVTGGVASGFQTFVGKLPGVAGRLALILHMAFDPRFPFFEIGPSVVENVAKVIREFIIPHALEFYRSAYGTGDSDNIRRLASWLITSKQTIVTSRDLMRNVWSLRDLSLFDLQTRLSPLVAGGWLDPVDPGPANKRWTVTPLVAAQFERRRQFEETRKAKLAELMGSPRKADT